MSHDLTPIILKRNSCLLVGHKRGLIYDDDDYTLQLETRSINIRQISLLNRLLNLFYINVPAFSLWLSWISTGYWIEREVFPRTSTPSKRRFWSRNGLTLRLHAYLVNKSKVAILTFLNSAARAFTILAMDRLLIQSSCHDSKLCTY